MQVKIDQFQEWLDNPVTELFHQYLRDYLSEISKQSNPHSIPKSQDDLIALGSYITEVSIRCSQIDEIVNLSYDDIRDFYTTEED